MTSLIVDIYVDIKIFQINRKNWDAQRYTEKTRIRRKYYFATWKLTNFYYTFSLRNWYYIDLSTMYFNIHNIFSPSSLLIPNFVWKLVIQWIFSAALPLILTVSDNCYSAYCCLECDNFIIDILTLAFFKGQKPHFYHAFHWRGSKIKFHYYSDKRFIYLDM